MLPMRKNIIGDDALTIALREFHCGCLSWRFFVEHSAQFRLRNYLFKDGEFSAIKMLLLLLGVEMSQVKRPDTNLRDLERIEHVHGYRICPLVREVAANPAAKTFERLADINGFAVIIIKSIDAPLAPADAVAGIIVAVEE